MKLTPAIITFEGTECAGKTTAIHAVKQWIETTFDQEVVVVRVPGGTPAGMQIRGIVTGDSHGDISTSVTGMLFAADWRNSIEQVILPALQRGAMVLTDRCNLTCWVYQYQSPEIAELIDFNNRIKKPDTIFIMTTPFDVFVARRDARDARLNNARDYIPQETHDGMVERYIEYANNNSNCVMVDCLKTPDEIIDVIIRSIEERHKQ